MTIPITSSDVPYPLHLAVGEVPGEPGQEPIRGYAQAEQLKSLDLEARHAIKVGSIDAEGMDKLLSLVLGCLVDPDMMIVSDY